MYHGFYKHTKIIIFNDFDRQIRMISEGSCDMEDCSNGCSTANDEDIRTIILNSNNVSQYYRFYCIFDIAWWPYDTSLKDIKNN